MARQTILVIEDDRPIRRGIVDSLGFAGFQTVEAGDGPAGLKAALECSYDLLLLDLVLPHGDGLDILAELRRVRPTAPVIILTARGDEADRVTGLSMGADDYVVKPFSVRELLARIDAVLRRSAERPSDLTEVSFSGGVADLERREIRYGDGGRAELSDREAELLRYLAVNAGRAVSRDELLARIWRLNPRSLSTRTIDMHVARLRAKLRDPPDDPQVLFTVRGKGYMFARHPSSADDSAEEQ